MNPKEKAEELVRKFKPFVQFKMGVDQSYVTRMAKQCALVAVDEMIEHCYQVMKPFWEEVKQEIELL